MLDTLTALSLPAAWIGAVAPFEIGFYAAFHER
jgi:hypothetical protein